MSHERYEELLMKVVDGFATADERTELDQHITTCDECREELADFVAMKQETDAMTQRILQSAEIEPPRETPTQRATSKLAFTLIAIGTTILTVFGAYHFIADPEVPTLVKAGTAILTVGLLVLFGRVIWPRLGAGTKDPYEEIDR